MIARTGSQSVPSSAFDLVSRHFGLLICLVLAANAAVWWSRGVRRHPERRESYKKLTVGFFCWGSLPFLVLQVGVLLGLSAGTGDLLEGGEPTLIVGLFYGACVLLWVLGTYWMFFLGGADAMARHPGLANIDVRSPTAWKALWALAVLGGIAGLCLRLYRPIG